MERLRAYMARMFRVIVGKNANIYPVPKGSDELGYTTKSGEIYIGFDNDLMNPLPEKLRNVFLIGVFVHEMLHQIYTDFTALEKVLLGTKSNQERQVISLLSNIVEDPYIEFHAPEKIGGTLLKALRFSIRWVYKTSGAIAGKSDFTELCNALIQFGDMGLLKGAFSNGDTFRFFKNIAPEFNDLIKSSTPDERVAAAARWTDLTRPLWEKEENLEDTVKNINSSNGISSYGDTGEAEESESEAGNSEKTPEEKRRDEISKILNSEGNSAAEESEGTEGKGSGSDKKDPVATELADTQEGEYEESDTPGGGVGALFKGDAGDEIIFDEIELFDEDIDKIEQDLGSTEKGKNEIPFIQDLDFPVSSRIIKSASCLNHRLMTSSPSAKQVYNEIVRRNEAYIRDLVKSFRKIFVHDEPEMVRSTSGYYNVKRAMLGTTTKIFDKRRQRSAADDISIFILVDESGSMQGEKIEKARETAIILAETFSRLTGPNMKVTIPLYVMGFTADTEGRNVVHDHFVTWSNTEKERYSLAFLQAKANNCDGYSIRYAQKILSQRKTEHKLMFIISDGLPACSFYRGNLGLADTAESIRDAKKHFPVIGIGLGSNCSPAILKKFYQDSFVFVKSEKDLTKRMVEVLKSLVKKV